MYGCCSSMWSRGSRGWMGLDLVTLGSVEELDFYKDSRKIVCTKMKRNVEAKAVLERWQAIDVVEHGRDEEERTLEVGTKLSPYIQMLHVRPSPGGLDLG